MIKQFLSFLLVCSLTPAFGVTHVIVFGVGGFTYQPANLTVAVGDTVEWQGNFSAHPLQSLEVPTSAPAISNSSGTVFRYPVETAGLYRYQCQIHGSMGMTGRFTAIDPAGFNTGAWTGPWAVFPTRTEDIVRIQPGGSGQGEKLSAEVYTLPGQLVFECKPDNWMLDLRELQRGIYLVILKAGSQTLHIARVVKE